uniref:Ig-like domain-containing protein n=1 Tax=Electrophorus electricus TaxID=8005 RepID=A0A4W4ERT8_ELEEL
FEHKWIVFILASNYHGRTQKVLNQDSTLLYVNEGDNITVTCLYQSDIDMHFSWYKHKFSQKPELIATIYKYDTKATFYDGFKNNARFTLVIGKDRNYLVITELEVSDSATYYCGNAQSNIVEFGKATKLTVKASQSHSLSVLQQPVLEPVHPGNSVTLQCTVLTENYAGGHSVYWFRHDSGESLPGIIHTHGDISDKCKNSSKARSPTQSCVYELPVENLRLSDAGAYYCAVAICGEIIFGNGTKLDIKVHLIKVCLLLKFGLYCFINSPFYVGKYFGFFKFLFFTIIPENCTSWNSTILALATSNIICVSVIVILGRLLCKHWLQSKTNFKLHNFQKDF